MVGKRLFLVLAAGALLFLQFADCMSAMMQDQQSMKCCGSMPCTPANQSHDCCKAMVSAQAPNMLPSARVSLNAPAAVSIETNPNPSIVGAHPLPPGQMSQQKTFPPRLRHLTSPTFMLTHPLHA